MLSRPVEIQLWRVAMIIYCLLIEQIYCIATKQKLPSADQSGCFEDSADVQVQVTSWDIWQPLSHNL